MISASASVESSGTAVAHSGFGFDLQQWLFQFKVDMLSDQKLHFDSFFSQFTTLQTQSVTASSLMPSSSSSQPHFKHFQKGPEVMVGAVPARLPKSASTLTANLPLFGSLDHWFKNGRVPEHCGSGEAAATKSMMSTTESNIKREPSRVSFTSGKFMDPTSSHGVKSTGTYGSEKKSLASGSRSMSSLGERMQHHWRDKVPRKSFNGNEIRKSIMIQGQESKSFRSAKAERKNAEIDSHFHGVITDSGFDVFCGIVIGMNALLVGVETEYLAQSGSIPKSIDDVQMVFGMWYLVEWTIRVVFFRWEFINGPDRKWNLFDTILAIISILDLCVSTADIEGFRTAKTARLLRAVRLFRIVRTLRIFRTFKRLREFRKMAYSLIASIQTLVWTLLLVFGAMYFFALWFTQTAAYHKYDSKDIKDAELAKHSVNIEEFYSSFSRTLYSLFGAISGAYSWHVLLDPWIGIGSHFTVVVFLVYIVLSVFGLLNIVTSIFVESAMHATKHFQDLLMDSRRKDLEMYTYHLEKIFKEIDKDKGGTLSFEEMANFLSDEESELPQYLEALGISSDDVWVLFKLLDKGQSGVIGLQEFCEGCLRLKGEARSFDINCLIYESRAMAKAQSEFMEFVEDRFTNLERHTGRTMRELDRHVFFKDASRTSGYQVPNHPSYFMTPRLHVTAPSIDENRASAYNSVSIHSYPCSPLTPQSNKSLAEIFTPPPHNLEDNSSHSSRRSARRGATQPKTSLPGTPRQPPPIEEVSEETSGHGLGQECFYTSEPLLEMSMDSYKKDGFCPL